MLKIETATNFSLPNDTKNRKTNNNDKIRRTRKSNLQPEIERWAMGFDDDEDSRDLEFEVDLDDEDCLNIDDSYLNSMTPFDKEEYMDAETRQQKIHQIKEILCKIREKKTETAKSSTLSTRTTPSSANRSKYFNFYLS